ncbi:hypothetical protein EVG20_g9455 [Dentipellis fragilis]|uniref:Uncharacterized protein n=1 Tax=Dentipellis fragilis TaxID=205917 RepID=A0A4Y9Y020_9AGAM|nr:hypothetical protein EVG20_g9455 [Dentipellis fragilis]
MPRNLLSTPTDEHEEFFSTVVRSPLPTSASTAAVPPRSLPRRRRSFRSHTKPAGRTLRADGQQSTQFTALQHLFGPSHSLTQRGVFLAIAPPVLFVVVIIAVLLALRTHVTVPPSIPPVLAEMRDVHIKVETDSVIGTALLWAQDTWRRWAVTDGEVSLRRAVGSIASLCAAILILLRTVIWFVALLIGDGL